MPPAYVSIRFIFPYIGSSFRFFFILFSRHGIYLYLIFFNCLAWSRPRPIFSHHSFVILSNISNLSSSAINSGQYDVWTISSSKSCHKFWVSQEIASRMPEGSISRCYGKSSESDNSGWVTHVSHICLLGILKSPSIANTAHSQSFFILIHHHYMTSNPPAVPDTTLPLPPPPPSYVY
jgi:hypothetical protein